MNYLNIKLMISNKLLSSLTSILY